jgi:hypothetical protein
MVPRQTFYTTSPALYVLVIFETVLFFAQAGLDCDLSIYASCLAGMTGIHHQVQFVLVEMGHKFLAQAGFEP